MSEWLFTANLWELAGLGFVVLVVILEIVASGLLTFLKPSTGGLCVY